MITVNLKMRLTKKEKSRLNNQKTYAKHRDKRIAEQKAYFLLHKDEIKVRMQRYSRRNKDKRKIADAKYYSVPANRIKSLVGAAKSRKREMEPGLAESLVSRIPTHCPCCGIELNWATHKGTNCNDSASLDRFNNDLGYTIANTNIICRRCNRIKHDCKIDEIFNLTIYLLRNGAK